MATIITESVLSPLFDIINGNAFVSEGLPVVTLPTNIVQTSQPWNVTLGWETTGTLNNIMCGCWNLQVLLERMGQGEFDLGAQGTATVSFVSAPNTYNYTFNFPAGSVPAGLYRVTVIITMTGAGGLPGPVAGYADMSLVQFYD